MFSTRPATQADLRRLADLWQERADINAQFDPRMRPAPDGASRWQAAAEGWLTNPAYTLLIALRDDLVMGYVLGAVDAAPPGMLPEKIAIVREMAVDAHRGQGGVGGVLLDALLDTYAKAGFTTVIANVPRRAAVEQAFWRARGARVWVEQMWLRIDR